MPSYNKVLLMGNLTRDVELKYTPSNMAVANSNTNPQIPQTVPSGEDEAKPDKFGVFINKRPMKDRAKETIARVEEKKLQLDKPFKVIIEGTLGLGEDGKTTVLKNPKALPVDPNVPNDPEMVKLAQEWILPVGDAGWYAYLDRLDDKTKIKSGKVVITIEQTDTEFLANIRSEKASENAAKSIASGLGLLLEMAAAATGIHELAHRQRHDGLDLVGIRPKGERPVADSQHGRHLEVADKDEHGRKRAEDLDRIGRRP